MNLTKFNKAKRNSKIGIYVSLSMDILDRLNYLLTTKFNDDINQLAFKLGKSLEETTNLLNGVQNYDLKTLAELEAAFDESIIIVEDERFDLNLGLINAFNRFKRDGIEEVRRIWPEHEEIILKHADKTRDEFLGVVFKEKL